MRNVPDKVLAKIKTHILGSAIFFLFENHAIYEKKCVKNIVERGSPQMTIWRMRIACWMPKATNTHSQYVILIAITQQQWLHERSSLLRCTYIVCLVLSHVHFVSLPRRFVLMISKT